MTAQAATLQGRSLSDVLAALPRRPTEGWLSLLTTGVMLFAVGFSLQDAGWTADAPGYAGLLSWLGIIGLLFGFAGAKIGWGRWRTHLVGALFAGVFIPLIVGGIAIGEGVGWDPASLFARMEATLGAVRRVWFDLAVQGQPFTGETAHYPLVFGGLMWGAGMLAGYTVFGHRRPLDAVVVLGLILLANMAVTHDQLWLLVLFSSAALLLLIRTHVFEEEVTWVRRRIGDPAAVSQVYLIAGAQFVIVAVLGSILLTATASSAPLQGLWQDLPQHLQTVSQWLQRFTPPGLDVRGLGTVTFGDDAETSGVWQPSNRVAFRAQLPRGEERQFKWRAGTYAVYTTRGWDWGSTQATSTGAGGALLQENPGGDLPTATGRAELDITIIPDAFRDRAVVSPNALLAVDRATNALGVGAQRWFTTVESTESIGTYNVTALVPVFRDAEDGITEPRLRLAGTDYPAGLLAIYTALPENSMGTAATDLLAAIRAEVTAPAYADADNAYDLARTMQEYFRNDANFRYQEDVRAERNAQCGGLSTVECFARMRVGYCDYYASSMAVLLRQSGVPARVAYGFLPGERGLDGLEVVRASTSHYWVEVYFPGVGWIEFDPTGGGVGVPQAIPSSSVGPVTAPPSAGPATQPPGQTIPPIGGPGEPPPPPAGTSIGPFIVIGIILAIGIGALAFAAYRRSPGRPMDPEQAWGSVSRLASRFGLGPRPSQTVYEYAGSLGDAVPAARIELTTIARAKVEVAYGKRDLGTDGMRMIANAYRRLRFAILGVVLRRGFRRRRGGR